MKKNSILFLLIIISVLFITLLPSVNDWIKSNNNLNSKDNQYTFQKGSYIVGKDLKPGRYDIEVIEGQITFMQKDLKVNDKIINLSLTKSEVVDITGNGKASLTPHSTEKVILTKSNSYNIIHSGYYEVGKDIAAGDYLLTLTIKNNEESLPLVQILNKDEMITDSFSFENINEYDLVLKEGQILEVHKNLFYESDNITITLTKYL